MNNLWRTENIKYTTYFGDGKGRDQYITFCNGGLNELRTFKGSNPNRAFA